MGSVDRPIVYLVLQTVEGTKYRTGLVNADQFNNIRKSGTLDVNSTEGLKTIQFFANQVGLGNQYSSS